ncbi:MAG: FeS-binding protein [Desulfuromonadales bacterium GWD2_61_12]|nr:MAG: FeS-binding protein [Desulfuromonadales bacterium GWC2_61_20]OGR35204.1 MAG: FeS-binding protein [Desulfuromonadales bacterium GWD2_61_12]HAD03894.1 FeS-binding protein [Desulfuromonas sp.]HBT83537.1 FeS-binding protein [Desulfuromonas sp.]
MIEELRNEIRRFVREDPGNGFADGSGPYFAEPLVGIAAAADPLFRDYKTIIGPFYLLPQELLASAASVICWVLPIVQPTRASNRLQSQGPSREWALTRSHGEAFNGALRRHLVAWLEGRGGEAAAPQFSPLWREFAETPVGIASNWSERHTAYVAGLGTFSLNDGFITEKGMAHRCGSVITDLSLPPSPRPYPNHLDNCLYHRNGSCGACIGRCPVQALSYSGHDKERCRAFVYGAAPQALAETYGVAQTGCGLCQTRVPCEAAIPLSGRTLPV